MTENMYALNAGEAGEAIRHAAHTFFTKGIYRPIILWGDPGVGKTEACTYAANATSSELNVQHLADREPTELGGIYWERDGKMVRLPPEQLPLKDGVPTILFFDETPQAPMMNKNLLARLVLDRRIGDAVLGDKVYVCAAGNYMHNRAGTSAMPSHLNARFSHLHVVPDVERWSAWAAANGLHPFVVAYHKHAPLDHHKADPLAEASANPRAWRQVSDIEFSGYPPMLRKSMIIGTIGKEIGDRYLAQAELYAGMPDVEDVYRDPKGTPLPANRSVTYAMMCALAATCKASNVGAAIEYTNRLVGDEEYQAFFLREAKLRNPTITSASAYTKFALSPKGQKIA